MKLNLLAHSKGRGLVAFAFYFAEGVPIGFIWWAMPTLMRREGIGVDVIGSFTALLTLPWIFKFLWAPLVDTFRTAHFGFKKWIGTCQLLMCCSLLPLLFIPLAGNSTVWISCLFLHSLFAATQDVSVDALVINIVATNETGKLNGFMQAGMLLGRSLFGGGALLIAQQLGVQVTIGFMIIAIMSTMLLLIFMKEPTIAISERSTFPDFRKKLAVVFSSKYTWFALAFALTAAAAFEAAGAFAGPLFTDLGMSEGRIGFFFAVPVVVAMLVGGLAGGAISDRIGRKKAVSIFLGGFVIMVTAIAVTGLLKTAVLPEIKMLLYTMMYFFTGMFTAASYALFMDITDPKIGATQFSSFMAATNGCEAWAVFTTGIVAASAGYAIAFLLMCGASLISLLFLVRLPGSSNSKA